VCALDPCTSLSDAEGLDDGLGDLAPGVLLLAGDQATVANDEGLEQTSLDVVRAPRTERISMRQGMTF
jgi:hypothetical protein